MFHAKRVSKILVFMLALIPHKANARLVEGATDSRKSTHVASQAPTGIQAMGEKLNQWLNQWKSARSPASAETSDPSSVPTRSGAAPPPIVNIPKIEVLKTTLSTALPDSALKKNAAGVPIFDVFQSKTQKVSDGRLKRVSSHVEKIPLLKIGLENSLTAADFNLPEIKFINLNQLSVKEYATPLLTADKELSFLLNTELAQPPVKISLSFLEGEQVVTRERVDAVKANFQPENLIVVAEYRPLTAEDYLALKAFIFFDKKDKCHLATGFLYSLLETKKADYMTSANLDLGLCLHDMGLFTESVKHLSEVIRSGDDEQVGLAVTKLVTDLPLDFEHEVSKILRKVNPQSVDEKSLDAFHYVLAKGAALDGDYQGAETYSALISKRFAKYDQAQYLLSVAEYANGQVDASIRRQKELLDRLEKGTKQTDLVSLVAMNLGRTSFQNKNFEEAANYFMRIRKDNSLWVNALVEQGWAQLQKNDPEGAIGNMYSIHSPFFKAVYKPESFVVRTIGYLNICQYGDAYRTLTQLETQYRPWNENMRSYLAKKQPASQIYSDLISFLRTPTAATVDGLPSQVLREIGHSRQYLNIQEAINNKVDEGEQYNFLTNLIDKDKENVKWRSSKAQQRIVETQTQIGKSEKDTNQIKNLAEWKSQVALDRDYIEFFRFKISLMEEAKHHMLRFRDVARVNLNQVKEKLKIEAGQVLNQKLVNLQKELSGILDNNELLRYETFSGSGENIRYHMGEAGNGDHKVSQRRVAADVKPKAMKWDVDGEYWEDEIGNYRSSLKNNCPKNRTTASH